MYLKDNACTEEIEFTCTTNTVPAFLKHIQPAARSGFIKEISAFVEGVLQSDAVPNQHFLQGDWYASANLLTALQPDLDYVWVNARRQGYKNSACIQMI